MTPNEDRTMFSLFDQGFNVAATRLAGALGTVADHLRSAATQRIEYLSAVWRAEVQRVATVLALSLALAFFICAAAAFAMFAFMLSFWETHRVLAAWLVTGGFAIMAWLTVIVLRHSTRATESENDRNQ